MSAVNVGPLIIQADAVDRGIGGLFVKAPGVELGDLAPRGHVRRSDIRPVFAAVAGDMNQAVVRARPYRVHIYIRGSYSIDDPATLRFFGQLGFAVNADTRRNLMVLAGKVGTDDLPGVTAARSFEQDVAGEIEDMRVDRGEEQRLSPQEAVLAGTDRFRADVLDLSA